MKRPDRAVRVLVEPGEVPHHEFLVAGRMLDLAAAQGVDDVPRRRVVLVVAHGDPGGSVRLHLLKWPFEPEILGTVQIARPLGDERDVDALDDVVAGVQVDPLDPAGSAVAVVELDVGRVDAVGATDGSHRIPVALVDRRLGCPQRRHRLTGVAHVAEGLRVDAARESTPTVFGLRPDGGHPGERHRPPVGAHGERQVREARRQLAVHERAQRPLRADQATDDVVRAVPKVPP